MARIRMIKPEFFDDPDAADLSPLARLFFIGLWTQADREGRLIDDTRRLAARLFPYESVDVEALAVELHGKDMIRRYQAVDGRGYIWVRSFTKHQRPHPKEPQSVIPACPSGAGKRNGEPRKETASPSESGFWDTEAGTRNLGSGTRGVQAAAAPPSPSAADDSDKNLGVITKIAHEAIDLEGVHAELGHLADVVKNLCSLREIAYGVNSTLVRKAVDSALVQRQRRLA